MADSQNLFGAEPVAHVERVREAIRRENHIIRTESRLLRRFCQARRAARAAAAIERMNSQSESAQVASGRDA